MIVGIVGAAGYIGGELLRLLLGHPRVSRVVPTSTRLAGRRVDGSHPNLRGLTDLTYVRPDRLTGCDVVFRAVSRTADPAGRDVTDGADLLVDLSPDLRLEDPAVYRRYYAADPPAPALAAVAVPGWPERYRAELRRADVISVPGCMATAATLALHPLAAEKVIESPVTVDGRMGSSGSGASAGDVNLHAERAGALRVFAPLEHRHEAEIAAATGVQVRMAATGVSAVRGVQVLVRATAPDVSENDVRALYHRWYRTEPFVRIVAQRRGAHRYPDPKILLGSNFCDIGFAVDPVGGRIVLIAALDNLVKGGAGNAVQCLNIRMGWPERLGLEFAGLHPN